MQVEQAKKMAEDALAALSKELERGESATLKAHLAAMARFPRYSVNNTLLILAQKPDAQHCAGLRTWNRLGRYVRKGERGIVILAPIVRRLTDRDHTPGRSAEAGPALDMPEIEREHVVCGFRNVFVFDVNQTEGEPLPEFASVAGDPGPYTDRLMAFIAERGIKLEYSRRIAPALGACSGGTILVLPNLSPATHLSTLAHELGHALLHKCDRGERVSRMVRETEAEAVAFVVCQAIGLDSIGASADYVTLYQGDAQTLGASLERVQRVASEIIAAIRQDG